VGNPDQPARIVKAIRLGLDLLPDEAVATMVAR
jgi:hypothetical protein